MADVREKMQEYIKIVEEKLFSYLPKAENGQDIVCDAMRYSITNGGKRIRPVLVLEFCRLCGGNIEKALPFACAVEMIHTYSLIHDDLPCMDDDDMRRGKPSCHIKFGEEYALLAGDGLLNLAFETMLKETLNSDDTKSFIKAAYTLARSSGVQGMIGGQVIDLLSENSKNSLERLKVMDKLKTGALIEASCLMGCIIANADEEKLNAALKYAENIGLAFQIVDDILDVIGEPEELGKPIGSDEENEKTTYVSILGLDEAKNYAEKLSEDAVSALTVFGDDAEFLSELARLLCVRKK
ncbi:MAG: polyprenyl synthetase family protein [Clostridiales bacterium]|nr:polyprenyl synthetase family protein [Clostridiales bacterium]